MSPVSPTSAARRPLTGEGLSTPLPKAGQGLYWQAWPLIAIDSRLPKATFRYGKLGVIWRLIRYPLGAHVSVDWDSIRRYEQQRA